MIVIRLLARFCQDECRVIVAHLFHFSPQRMERQNVLHNMALIRQEPLQKGQFNCNVRRGNRLGKACSLF
jgi:hypothetical protein